MKIKIAFSTAKSDLMIFARGISAIEKRKYSHVLVIYSDPYTNIDMVFQASNGMVNNCSLKGFLTVNDIVKSYDLEFSEEQFKDFYIFMLNTLGAPYAWRQIIGIFIHKLLHIQNPFASEDKRKFICSKLGAIVAHIKGIPIPVDTNDITPSDLDKILQDNQ